MSLERQAVDVFLLPGQIAIHNQPICIRTIVGSCVAVCLWDRARHVGGMNHFLLPEPGAEEQADTRHGAAATTLLIQRVCGLGGLPESMDAAVIGGGSPIEQITFGELGARNAAVALQVLRQHRIRIVRQETGGAHGRKLFFNPHTGELVVEHVRGLAASLAGGAT